MSLAVKLRELRSEKKVSLQVVADEIGVSKPHVWELEKGKTKNPSLELLKELAGYYGVTLDYLAGVGEDRNESERYHTLLRKLDPENMTDSEWDAVTSAIDFAMGLLKKGK